MIPNEQLEAWAKLAESATPGSWSHVTGGDKIGTIHYVVRAGYEPIEVDCGDDDAAFIVAAREAVPALVQEVRRLQADNDILQAGCDVMERVASLIPNKAGAYRDGAMDERAAAAAWLRSEGYKGLADRIENAEHRGQARA